MSESHLQRTEALRDELFRELQELDPFKAVQALDDAVFAMGGERRLPRKGGVPIIRGRVIPVGMPAANANSTPATTRLSQPDAAEMILKATGKPMTVRELVPLVLEKGVQMTAGDRVASLGSQLSRNPDRFEMRRVEGQHLWWVKSVPWPRFEGPSLGLVEME